MDHSAIGFPNPSDPSHKYLSFQAGLTENMTSFSVGWSVNNMGPKFSDVQGFEIPGLGREQQDVDRIQLQDNSSTSSEQTVAPNDNLGRKRKACKDLTNTSPDVKKSKDDDYTAKRSRTLDNASKELSEQSGNLNPKDSVKESSTKQQQEPPKDYIHVRARRGQATDSHSLAERVRREKISERMKFLQALVPGCSKVTGKKVMLDEIINYVQSLQRQIEFLSMKLAALDPRNMENLLNKELAAQARRSPETTLLGPDPLASYRDYLLHMQIQAQINDHCNMDLRSVNGILCEHACLVQRQLPPQMTYSDSFVSSLPQTLTGVCDGDLQTIVQMSNRKDFFGQGVNGRSFISPGLS